MHSWGKKNYLTKRRVSFNIPSTDDDDCDDDLFKHNDNEGETVQTADMHDRDAFLESRPRQLNQPREEEKENAEGQKAAEDKRSHRLQGDI